MKVWNFCFIKIVVNDYVDELIYWNKILLIFFCVYLKIKRGKKINIKYIVFLIIL